MNNNEIKNILVMKAVAEIHRATAELIRNPENCAITTEIIESCCQTAKEMLQLNPYTKNGDEFSSSACHITG